VTHRWSGDGIDIEVDGRRAHYRVSHAEDGHQGRLQLTGAGGGVGFDLVPRFAPPQAEAPGGSVMAPMPGTVLELRVSAGQTVAAGDVVAVLEAMKMENHLTASEDGLVAEVRVAVGDQVAKDTLLLVIEPASTPVESA
jgi:propionyl-CoA carboxylase alpha chain